MSDTIILGTKCPDCGAMVAMPTHMDVSGRGGTISLTVDEDGFFEAMFAHVKLNVDIHPTFTTDEDEDIA